MNQAQARVDAWLSRRVSVLAGAAAAIMTARTVARVRAGYDYADAVPPGEPAWRAVHRAADKSVPAVQRVIVKGLLVGAAQLDRERIETALAQLDWREAERLMNAGFVASRDYLDEHLPDVIHKTIVAGGKAAAASATNAGSLVTAEVAVKFDVTEVNAVRYARTQAAAMVREIMDETRVALRRLVTRAFLDGVPPRDLARMIAGVLQSSGAQIAPIYGLTSAQMNAVLAKRVKLLQATAGQSVKLYGKTAVRIPKGGLKPDALERAMGRYSSKLLRGRALNIARTETIRATNRGQELLWDQQVKKGNLHGKENREWIATPDDRLCPACAAMNGQVVQLGQPFQGAAPFAGDVQGPPLHPSCRCAQGLTEKKATIEGTGSPSPAAVPGVPQPVTPPPPVPVPMPPPVYELHAFDASGAKTARHADVFIEDFMRQFEVTRSDIEAQLSSIQKEITAATHSNNWQRAGQLSKQSLEIHESSLTAFRDQLADAINAGRGPSEVRKVLLAKSSDDFTAKQVSKAISEPLKWLEKVIPQDSLGTLAQARKKLGVQFSKSVTRSYYSNNWQTVFMETTGSEQFTNEVFVHEFGHFYENNAWAREASSGYKNHIQTYANKYRAARAPGEEPVKLKSLHRYNGYRDDEITLRDKWRDPYTGKVYPGQGDTEVISMGLQQMYADPQAMLRDDPDFFRFILQLLLTGETGL